ncbi:MAG TPA: DUF501 domain-containing protein [Kosmotogaceae bacterium]|nr:DUF501 domain-containing protein [Kosmotogaceae bacterium]
MGIVNSDKEVIEWQIGRKLENEFEVCAKCQWGYPVSFSAPPIVRDRPFPTIHWLCCPHLCKEISKLEAEGLIDEMEARLSSDDLLCSGYIDAHKSTNRVVMAQLKRNQAPLWFLGALEGRGIGGMKDFTHIKCLHMHVANLLCGVENPIGKIVLEMIESHNCSDPVICSRSHPG